LGNSARVRLEDGLSQSARDFCIIQKGMRRVQESDDEAQARLTKYGRFHGDLLQNVAFCNVSPEELILDWVIDDGNPSKSHRDAIFNRNIGVVGIASGPNPVGRVVVVLFAHDYTAAGTAPGTTYAPAFQQNSYSAPPVQSHYQAPAPVSHAPVVANKGGVYPDFIIGSLVPSSDGKANLLSITNLGCSISELYLGTRSNGNSVEFSRKTPSGSETRVFGLPYQVTAATTSAT
jgi:hypothetical protein